LHSSGPWAILVVHEEPAACSFIQEALEAAGHAVALAHDARSALRVASAMRPELVVCALLTKRVNGLELLAQLRADRSSAAVSFLALAASTREPVARAIKLGAEACLVGPLSRQRLIETVDELCAARIQRRQGATRSILDTAARRRLHQAECYDPLATSDPAVLTLLARIRALVAAREPLVIVGEGSTAKEQVAEQVHCASGRSGMLIAIDCEALPAGLLEDELFGHEGSSRPGSGKRKLGLLEFADGGALYLHRSELLSVPLLNALLEVSSDGRVGRAGPVEARILFGLTAPFNAEEPLPDSPVRAALVARSCDTIFVPPLRDRRADIERLFAALIERECTLARRPVPRLTPEAVELLQRYSWPGNLRELREVSRAVAQTCDGQSILPLDLGPALRAPVRAPPARVPAKPGRGRLMRELERLETVRTIAALQVTEGLHPAAASILNISLRSLQARLRTSSLKRS
jgi:DNA-binding NtrC family response regulator